VVAGNGRAATRQSRRSGRFGRMGRAVGRGRRVAEIIGAMDAILPLVRGRRAARRGAVCGFTLIELLVVMVIAGILLAIGVPNMQSFFVSTRLDSASSDFAGILNLARSEATKRNSRVVVERTGATSRNWTDGWRVFVDINGNNTPDAGDIVIRETGALAGAMTLYSNTAAADRVVFDGQGRILSTAAMLFVYCYDGSNITLDGERRARGIIVSPSGRVRGSDYDTLKQPKNEGGTAVTSCTNPA
jgi:type IV fimbrial biogenesis protein FimT